MEFKAVFFCVSALLVQSISGQTLRGCYTPVRSSGRSSSGSVIANSIAIPNSGGDFPISSIGPVVPSGIALASDIGLAGTLDVCGSLPYLSAVAFEGSFPTDGSGAVSYGCGDGFVGIDNVIGGNSVLSGFSGYGCGC